VTVDWLADRMLTSAGTVLDIVAYAVDARLLEPFTVPTDTAAPVRPVVRARER
jgi:hypothetical protein